MQKYQVRDTGQALAYITDCNLATVCEMAMKKSRPKHEFNRQMSIAQTSIDWMVEMGVDVSTTRAVEVIAAGSVKQWAETYMPKDDSGTICYEHINHKDGYCFTQYAKDPVPAWAVNVRPYIPQVDTSSVIE